MPAIAATLTATSFASTTWAWSGRKPRTQTLTTADGLALHLQRWLADPAAGSVVGTVQIVHGLGEHIGRYAALARALNAAGWHVAGHDQRGHGRSGGARGTLAHPQALLHDLSAVIDHLRGAGRHVLLGHSLGGLVAARFVAESTGADADAERWSRDVDGLVLSSPALDAGLGAAQRALLALLSPVAPGLRLGNPATRATPCPGCWPPRARPCAWRRSATRCGTWNPYSASSPSTSKHYGCVPRRWTPWANRRLWPRTTPLPMPRANPRATTCVPRPAWRR